MKQLQKMRRPKFLIENPLSAEYIKRQNSPEGILARKYRTVSGAVKNLSSADSTMPMARGKIGPTDKMISKGS